VTGGEAFPVAEVASLRNQAVLDAVRLHRRKGRLETGNTLLEGPLLVEEAVARGATIQMLFGLVDDERGRALAVEAGVEYTTVTPEVLGKVATTETPQSPVAVITIPDGSVSPGGRVLVAWGVGDPGNSGTLIRTAAALSHGFLAGPKAADPWSPKVLRAAAGGHFRTGVDEAADLDKVRAGGRVLVATVAAGGEPPRPLPPDVAILVGSEPHGLPPEVVAAADLMVTIPMAAGAESLNAAVAGAIVAFVGISDSEF
jgi:TrmH family RNA methyltransferase